MADKHFNNYPTLTPKEFMELATIQGGLSVKEAIALSGFGENSWNLWLYRKKATQTYKDVVLLWLGNLAERQGWLKSVA